MTRGKVAPDTRAAGVAYRVEAADLHSHLYQVTLTIANPAAQQHVQLPAWIPGSYLVREFAKNLQSLRALQSGRAVDVKQLTKARWLLDCTADAPLELQYEVYAFDNSVRTAWLDATRGFFNGTSLFLMVEGQQEEPHTMDLVACADAPQWKVATGLPPVRTDKRGFGRYSASNYDMLVDCPVELGDFWEGNFQACGIPHRFVVAGAPPSFDGTQLLQDTQTLCEEGIRFWHGSHYKKSSASHTIDGSKGPIPFQSYLFILNATHDGYGGLEHRNSTVLLCTRKDLPRQVRTTLAPTTHKQPEGYTTLMGLISHEYFHTWNVKRLRPAEFARYDYTQENYTELLWFFEGFTSYYDDLLLRRAKRIDNTVYLKLLSKTINQVQQTPGRLVQTVAQASFDAWVKYYRQDENTPNATVSYYTKGSLVALCLDLTLHAEGKTTLDDVMRGLWKRCAGGPMAQDDLLAVLHELGGRSFAKDVARWVHSTKELPLTELLEAHGLLVNREPDQMAQQLGLRVKESGGLFIQQVLRGGVAEKAGFAAGDEWIAVEAETGPWRMQALDDLNLYTGKAKKIRATVARDKRLMTLTLTMPKPSQAVRLSVRDASAANKWLDGHGS
jgi:predicted metalloprotease with PDZ domain